MSGRQVRGCRTVNSVTAIDHLSFLMLSRRPAEAGSFSLMVSAGTSTAAASALLAGQVLSLLGIGVLPVEGKPHWQ
jgi:hypothetical protein